MNTSRRLIRRIIEPHHVIEGAGVRLRRSIGGHTVNYHDPFLLLDHFASADADDYKAGFPLHPHRGIETVTYILHGEVHHRDTVGNSGSIGAGDLQWMSAGGGIMHEEMPQVRPEGIAGFQLWVNLPAKLKMSKPRYQGINASEIPEIEAEGGAKVKIIAGSVNGARGPVSDIAADPVYLDVSLPSHSSFVSPIPKGHNAFAYIFEGAADFGATPSIAEKRVHQTHLVIFENGDHVAATTKDETARFLLVSAQTLGEPIARYGPFVMNTEEEIERALSDLQRGTFVWKASR